MAIIAKEWDPIMWDGKYVGGNNESKDNEISDFGVFILL